MFKTCFLLLFFTKISSQCKVPSFKNNTINVDGDYKRINGCISPDTIRFNRTIFYITAKYQDIQDLNYGAVQGISTLIRIDFYNTNIEVIRGGAFLDLPQLIRIHFESNQLFWIKENAFQDLPWLREVSLPNNNIAHVSPGSFSNLPNLTRVSFKGNKLEHVDQSWFSKTPHLQDLELSENRVRRIPRGAFSNLPSLTLLKLDNNEIELVDKDAFEGLRNLEFLQLANNKLKTFDFNFYAPSKLHSVYLQNNNITYISEEVLAVMRDQLSLFFIFDNPIQCACMDKILEWCDAFKIRVPQREVEPSLRVCLVPKTEKTQCRERSDEDFQKAEWINFERKRKSHQLLDRYSKTFLEKNSVSFYQWITVVDNSNLLKYTFSDKPCVQNPGKNLTIQ